MIIPLFYLYSAINKTYRGITMPSINKLLVNIDQNLSQDEKKQALANLGITTASGDVGKSLTVQDEQGTLSWSDNQGTFVAIYDPTPGRETYSTFDEIDDAYNSDKTIFLRKVESGSYRDKYIPLCYRTSIPNKGRIYYFISPDNLLRISIGKFTGWKVEDLPGFNWKEPISGSYIGTSADHVGDVWSDYFHGTFDGDVYGNLNGRWNNVGSIGVGNNTNPVYFPNTGDKEGLPLQCSAKFVYSVNADGSLSNNQYKICMDGTIGQVPGVIYCL
jgi:hypothetical protein